MQVTFDTFAAEIFDFKHVLDQNNLQLQINEK